MSANVDSDAALAKRAAQGDERAFTALMRRHKEAVYRVARRHLGDADEAFDVVQEVFVSAWRNIARYDPERPLTTWLFRITVNACRDRHRRRAVRSFFYRAAPMDTPSSVQVSDDSQRVEDHVIDREELRRVERAIGELPERPREAFLLYAVEGLSQAEVADALGVSVKAVETRVARARRLLTEMLDRET
ncbi:MAG: RNA polymerase sigma factor [Maricaulaceae bacterium]